MTAQLKPDDAAFIRWCHERFMIVFHESPNLDWMQRLWTLSETVDQVVKVGPEPKCVRCGHGHNEGSWSDRDPDDGTCWNAGSLVCGCPKFITAPVAELARARFTRQQRDGS
jgi:hypothetical protein